MATDEKVTQLENEMKVLKNEVQSVLLDLRDRYLETENPFNTPEPRMTSQQVIVGTQATAPASPPEDVHDDKDEPDMTEQHTGETESREAPATIAADKNTAKDKQSRSVLPTTQPANPVQIDLVTIAGLAQWAEKSTSRLGIARTETILDFSELMGVLPEGLRTILTKLINVETNANPDSSYSRSYLDSLIEITSLLGKDNLTEKTMLELLSGESDHR
jgi:hypothetical protein